MMEGRLRRLVYKIADASSMKTTDAFHPELLAGDKGKIVSSHSAKLSDTAIRSLCTGQYRVLQHASKPGRIFCEFEDIDEYGDDKMNPNKRCSAKYNPAGKYNMPSGKSVGEWMSPFPASVSCTLYLTSDICCVAYLIPSCPMSIANLKDKTWSAGFSTWGGIKGTTILQLNRVGEWKHFQPLFLSLCREVSI